MCPLGCLVSLLEGPPNHGLKVSFFSLMACPISCHEPELCWTPEIGLHSFTPEEALGFFVGFSWDLQSTSYPPCQAGGECPAISLH